MDRDTDRRRFLAAAGRFAAVTPPTVSLLLAAEGRNYVYAGSGQHRGDDYGNGKGKGKDKDKYKNKHKGKGGKDDD
jgi:hypothetical protein